MCNCCYEISAHTGESCLHDASESMKTKEIFRYTATKCLIAVRGVLILGIAIASYNVARYITVCISTLLFYSPAMFNSFFGKAASLYSQAFLF